MLTLGVVRSTGDLSSQHNHKVSRINNHAVPYLVVSVLLYVWTACLSFLPTLCPLHNRHYFSHISTISGEIQVDIYGMFQSTYGAFCSI